MADVYVNNKAQTISDHGHYNLVDLCWIVDRIEVLTKELSASGDKWQNQAETNAKLQAQIDELLCLVNELQNIIKNGDWPNDVLMEWADKNMPQLVAKIVKYVFFGLSRDGYFVAYIPQSWDFIKFDTDLDQNSPTWGHLILRW